MVKAIKMIYLNLTSIPNENLKSLRKAEIFPSMVRIKGEN